MNAATVNANNVYLLRQGTQLVATTLVYNASTRTATLTPISPLLASTSYTIYVLGGVTGVKDLSDNALAQSVPSVFQTAASSPGDTVAPVIVGFTPMGSSVPVNTAATVTFSEALSPSTINSTTVQLRNASTGVAVASTLSYSAGSSVVTLTPTSPLAHSINYLIVVQGGANGVRDAAGNAMANTATSPFTTAPAPDTTPPTVTGATPNNGSTNVSTSATASVTFSEAMNASTITSSTVRLLDGGTQVSASVSYNATSRTATITPTAALNNSRTYTISVLGGASGVKDVAGNALAQTFTSSFTTAAAAATTASLWTNSPTPAIVDAGDGSSVELGVRFTANTNGFITGLRFYKSAANTGTHVGSLWSSSGQLLATATFSNETASGWQQVNFSTPVAITAGTTYVASYFAPNGHYSVNRSYFSSGYSNGPLSVPASGGVYAYGNSSAFPSQSFQGSNYWVDVVLSTSAP
jgi:hypothetical protein